MDLKALRVQLDTLDVSQPQTLFLANALTTLLDEVETLQARVATLTNAANPEAHLPEECQKHECSYFYHYLAYGPADLTHEGYHQAEKKCEQAQNKVEEWYIAHGNNYNLQCPYETQATYWEKAVRA